MCCGGVVYTEIENLPIKELIDFMGEVSEVVNGEPKMSKLLFATDKMYKSDFYLKGNPISLIATNVPSFMGGKANPWIDA
jgi:hypothetical protein